jgi:tRNA(Arg) A34 adenosine deaminase TadA
MEDSKKQIVSSLDGLFSNVNVTQRRDFLVRGAALLTASVSGVAPAVAKGHKDNSASKTQVSDQDRSYMAEAIKLMRQAGVVDQTGGPFGCVIVRDGQVLAATGNSVIKDNDPTAHAEVNAIKAACKKVGNFHLDGATMFTSCECCPMCYSTAYWARIGKIYYAAAWSDYNDIFDDSAISADVKKPNSQRSIPMVQIMQPEAQAVWTDYRKLPQKTRY